MSEQTKKEYELDDLEFEDVTGGINITKIDYECRNCGNRGRGFYALGKYSTPPECSCGARDWKRI